MRVAVSGFLGTDPELKVTTNGKSYARARLAESIRVGEEFRTQWWSVVAWDDLADAFATASKGQRVIVVGRLQQREYRDQIYHEIVADDIGLSYRDGRRKEEV